MMKSERLKAAANLAPYVDTFSDVGSDHGYLATLLFSLKKVKRGILIENKKGPFSRLKKNIEEQDFKDEVVLSLSDGLDEVPLNTELLCLLGMGGDTIIKIFKKHEDILNSAKYLLIDSHSKKGEVREYLSSKGFIVIKNTCLIEDNIYYDIELYGKGDKTYSKEERYFGPLNLSHPNEAFIKHYQKKKDLLEYLLSNKELSQDKIKRIKEELKLYEGKDLWMERS